MPEKKCFIVSTPTIDGQSRIASAYQDSDQRKYYLPCPHCNVYQVLKWSQIKWPKGEPKKAFYVCEECHQEIEERYKTSMLEKGKWLADNGEHTNSKKVGFHLSSLYSPIGWFSWGDAAELWLESHKNPEKLRGFVNTVLGETWKEKRRSP